MRRYILFLILILSLILTSCKVQSSTNDRLRIAVSQEPPTFDVHVNSSQIARYVMAGTVFERVVTLDGEGNVRGELAEDFYSLNDMRSWVFILRENVPFHNGRVMDSEDVVLSLNRWLYYNTSARTMVGEAQFYSVDERTVRIDCERPALFLPYLMAASPQSAVVYAREMLESLDSGGLVTQYIGTGPYKVKEWLSGQYIELERFENYAIYGDEESGLWGPKYAYIPTLVYYFVPDSFARTAGCESGQYDFINDVMNDDIIRLEKNDSLILSRGEEAGSLVILFNKKEGAASHQYIRSAINTALDLDVVMAACYGSFGYNMHPDYMESHQKAWAVTDDEARYDVGNKEEARRILEENGYDGEPIRILSSNLSNLDRSALAVESELEKAGFNVEVTIVDWATMMDWRSDPGRWDLCITAMTQVPVPSLKLFLSADYAGWSNDAQLQKMMEALSSSGTMEEAQAKWKEIQDYCYDYLPAIVCGHYLSLYLYKDNLKNVNEYYGFYFYNATFD